MIDRSHSDEKPVVLGSLAGDQTIDDGEEGVVRNPADLDEVVGLVYDAPTKVVETAVDAAKAAYLGWRQESPEGRARALQRVADQIERQATAIARLQTREQGKIFLESQRNVKTAVRIIRYYADLAQTFAWSWEESSLRGTTRYTRDPVGVTAVIVPWNSPLTLGLLMTIPALIAGNTVVVKPARNAPLALGLVLQILAKELPPGVVNWVVGSGSRVGQALAEHPEVRRVAFTGSTDTGRELMRAASGSIKNLTLELGGNDPAIVLEDADLTEELFQRFVEGVYTASGQICLNIKRIYVHESLYTRFVEGFCKHVDRLVMGNPLDAATTLGPVNNQRQWQRIQELIDDSRGRGGQVIKLGQGSGWEDHHRGYFLYPTVVTEISPDAPIVMEEQFGPVVPVLPYQSWSQVRDWANDTSFGLCASLWTSDTKHAQILASDIEAGTTFFNIHRAGASDIDQAFGGVKQSGFGRGHGRWALEEATELHTWIVAPDPVRMDERGNNNDGRK